MALITVTKLRTLFPWYIRKDVLDARLEFSVAAASRRLKTWIGAEAYIAFEDANDSDDKQTLQHAEGYLAMHFALLGLNTNLRSKGIVKSEQAEGDTVNTYFTPTETANFVTQYLEMAREIAEPFLLSDGTPSHGFEVVADV